METRTLERFAKEARRQLLDEVGAKLEQVLTTDSAELREKADAIKELQKKIAGSSKQTVLDRVAYTWFNRFCALRFMDANHYTRVGVVSPLPGQTQPEILQDAKQGHISEDLKQTVNANRVFALLSGELRSSDPQQEAYRLLLVGVCNYYHRQMPFLFEKIDDYTELLMPDDLLSGNSILAYTREAMTLDACEDVEVIGWLYQFYISEKKDEVFDGLKKNKKITPENIPAATQLFTPHWIVRYLVENSLGRLWLLNRPGSKLIEQMDYYIKPEQAETDFLRISKPEEIKICDPACGSGHMLTYAFDLLYAIYEEEGYEPAEIPEKILTNNLYGIEIDERAGELAAFALTMKARSRSRRFFGKPVAPNVCVLQKVSFDDGELAAVGSEKWVVGSEKQQALNHDLHLFEEADNFGSLLRPQFPLEDIEALQKTIHSTLSTSHSLFEQATLNKVKVALEQASYLSPKYHVVIANPPYMGGKGMNGRLAAWVKDNYPNNKSDLFAMFIERNLNLVQQHGAVAMITMQSWMFLSSFEALRARLLGQKTILSMAHLGARAFDSIGGEVVSTTAFVLENANRLDYKGDYLRLIAGNSEAEKNDAIREAVKNPDSGWRYRASAVDFKKIPSTPIAYWVTESFRSIFNYPPIEKITISDGQNKTGNNYKFVRCHWELSEKSIGKNARWLFYAKGGGFRKWNGNLDEVVDWSESARHHYKKDLVCRIIPEYLWYKVGVTWGLISTSGPSFRFLPAEATFDVGGSSLFFKSDDDLEYTLGLLNTKLTQKILSVSNPTVNFQVRNIRDVPFSVVAKRSQVEDIVKAALHYARSDWDSYETSWDFTILSVLNPDYHQAALKATYQKLRAHWREMTLEMQRLEEENNRIFIDAYGLQGELKPDVPLNEITLTCNPHYRYGGNKSEDELEALLLADTMRELISYAVGCMFGRYALEKPGLILANQGETIGDYLKRFPDPIFPADDDNVIPMLDGDWFTDDIAERFRKFLRVAFGDEHYEDNLQFVEKALGKNGKARDIRDYFLKDFYSDHVKRYKKRPIYWLFSSPRGSFNALIYMHRYRPDTVSVVLNDYLREFRAKLASRRKHVEEISISSSASSRDKSVALKEIEKLGGMIQELDQYESEILYPLATQQIEIDLDDGVKANYPKFGKALQKVKGLSKE